MVRWGSPETPPQVYNLKPLDNEANDLKEDDRIK